MNTITFIKSRTNRAGQESSVVFNQYRGIDNVYTNYNLLKQEKLIGGAGRSFYLINYPDVKFSQKELKKKYATDKDFRIAFKKEVRNVLRQYIDIDNNEDDMDNNLEESNISSKEEVIERKTSRSKSSK